MGLSLRIFLINDDDSIQRLALAKYERLIECDRKERLPQYAGKQVRYALAVVELIHREPVEIILIQYSYLKFDSEGRLDPDYVEEEARLSLEVLPPLQMERDLWPVIDARHQFAKKRFNHKYKWSPTPEIEAAIMKKIF
jgi:hypothetical protein